MDLMSYGDQWREGMRDEEMKAISAEITEIMNTSTNLEIDIACDDRGKKYFN